MSWRRGIRRTGRQIRRRLGLPRFSARTWLLAILLLLGLLYVGTTVMTDFLIRLGQYESPQHYEPKDFSREEVLEKEQAKEEKKSP